MKIASLLVPTYMPSNHPGATPVPYRTSTLDKFERDLVALSPLVIRRTFGVTRLSADINGRFVHQQPITTYDIMVDMDTTALGDACDLVLKSFELESFTVINGSDAEPINAAAVEELQNGLHAWNETE